MTREGEGRVKDVADNESKGEKRRMKGKQLKLLPVRPAVFTGRAAEDASFTLLLHPHRPRETNQSSRINTHTQRRLPARLSMHLNLLSGKIFLYLSLVYPVQPFLRHPPTSSLIPMCFVTVQSPVQSVSFGCTVRYCPFPHPFSLHSQITLLCLQIRKSFRLYHCQLPCGLLA